MIDSNIVQWSCHGDTQEMGYNLQNRLVVSGRLGSCKSHYLS